MILDIYKNNDIYIYPQYIENLNDIYNKLYNYNNYKISIKEDIIELFKVDNFILYNYQFKIFRTHENKLILTILCVCLENRDINEILKKLNFSLENESSELNILYNPLVSLYNISKFNFKYSLEEIQKILTDNSLLNIKVKEIITDIIKQEEIFYYIIRMIKEKIDSKNQNNYLFLGLLFIKMLNNKDYIYIYINTLINLIMDKESVEPYYRHNKIYKMGYPLYIGNNKLLSYVYFFSYIKEFPEKIVCIYKIKELKNYIYEFIKLNSNKNMYCDWIIEEYNKILPNIIWYINNMYILHNKDTEYIKFVYKTKILNTTNM